MMTDRTDSTHFIHEPEPQLSPPRFDENAAANARPVQPIPVGRVAVFRRQAGSVWRAVGGKSRILALIVIAGLAIGALGAMSWVRYSQETSATPAANESLSVLPGAATEGEEPGAAVIGGADLQSTAPAITRVRKNRKRVRAGRTRDRVPRAYRVAVIR